MVAEYSAWRRLTMATVSVITTAGVPAVHNWVRIICEAPPNTTTLIAQASHAGMPAPTASTP
ncbi:hypothetical protein D3C72_2141780 [compost metagenome]